MDMKLLDEVKKMAALDQRDKEFLKTDGKTDGTFPQRRDRFVFLLLLPAVIASLSDK